MALTRKYYGKAAHGPYGYSPNLQPMIEGGRLERNITVTVEYGITGGSPSHEWEIDPVLYEGLRNMGYKDMGDLVDAVEKVAEDGSQEEQGE